MLALALLLVFCGSITAATYEWDAGAGAIWNWSNPTNWTEDIEPNSTNDAWVNGGYTAVVAQAGAVAGSLHIGSSNAPTPALSAIPTGTVRQIGYDLTLGEQLVLGENQGAMGTYTITGGVLSVGSTTIVGVAGIGYMTVTGTAAVSSLDTFVVGWGDAAGGEDMGSALTVAGGTLDIGKSLEIGNSAGGEGTVIQADGLLSVTDLVVVGNAAFSTGTLSVTGGELDHRGAAASEHFIVGNSGQGTMTISGVSTVTVSQGKDLIIGAATGGDGNVNVQGGLLDVGQEVILGNAAGADGSLSVSGGTVGVPTHVWIGSAFGSVGAVTLSGGTVTNAGGNVYVGQGGQGTLTVSAGATLDVNGTAGSGDIVVGGLSIEDNRLNIYGGTVDVADSLVVAQAAVTRGSVLITNGTLTVPEDVIIGNSSTGSMTMTHGTITIGDDFILGYVNGGEGSVVMSNGLVDVTDMIHVGSLAGSEGTLTVAGGRLESDDELHVGSAGAGSMTISGTGTVVLTTVVTNGLDLHIAATAGSTGSLSVAGGYLEIPGSLNIGQFDGGSMSVSGGTVYMITNAEPYVRVGNNAPGTLDISGGAVDVYRVYLADSEASAGSAFRMGGGELTIRKLTGGGTLSFVAEYDSTIDVSGGTIDASEYVLGRYGNATVTMNVSGGTVRGDHNFNVGAGDGETCEFTQTGGTLDLNGEQGELRIGYDADNTFGYYTITAGVISVEDNLELGRNASGGTGILHVVGSVPDITVGDNGGSGDFRMRGDNAELRMTFVSSKLTTITANGSIGLNGTLTISNEGAVAAGEYLILTSLTDTVVSSFDATNWAGGVEGKVVYENEFVSLVFSPELEVRGTNELLVVASGDSTPSAADGTDFGDVERPNSLSHTFTITNRDATYTLSLTGATAVAISGDHAADFVVTADPEITLLPGTGTTFTIRFTPSSVGTRTALVSIANNDISETENPYTFAIQGEGVYAVVPTLDASNMVFTAVTNIAMTVSWTNGNGAKRILVAKASTAIVAVPQDGSNYTASAAFSNGITIAEGEYVVYNDTGSSIRVTNLLPGVVYYFKLFEYNGTSGGENYRTTTPLSGVQAAATYAPVIAESDPQDKTISENSDPTPFSLTLNRTDPDLDYGDVVTWSIRNLPEHGTASASGTGPSVAVAYTPSLYYSGTDSFVVQAVDKFGNAVTLTVNVTIEAVNLPGKTVFIFE